MADLITDSNVLVGSFLSEDRFHNAGLNYVNRLENGDDIFHVPMLVPVEVVAAIWRRSQKLGLALVARALKSFDDWEADGRIVLYPLDRARMDAAMNVAVKYRFSGSDSVIVALAEELNIPLKTFDQEIQRRFTGASS